MHVISRKTLKEFYEKPEYADAKGPLLAWFAEAKTARWRSPADIKRFYRNASILKDSRAVFNIGGNKYRLAVKIRYAENDGENGTVYIRFVGTHAQYDAINACEV